MSACKLMNVKDLIADAYKNRYAVAAMNANGANYDIARAILEGAAEEDSPIIIQAYEHNILPYRGYEYFVQLAEHLAQNIKIPFAIGLDHGNAIDSVMKAVKAGFSGVMLDNSHYEPQEYKRLCVELVKHLRPMNVSLEAEVGNMAQLEELDRGNQKTDIADIQSFISAADVDLIAISVGTSHGIHETQDNIDYELIKKARRVTDIPLVMHGTSGVPLESITRAVKAGMRKINFGEGLRINYIKYFNRLSQELDHKWHSWIIMREAMNQLKEDVKKIIRAINS